VWIDVGAQDSFRAADATLAQALRDHGADVQLHVWPGGHDGTYWDAHWTSYLAFYAGALASCRAG
jgi:enterochelin esterase-like enzyme